MRPGLIAFGMRRTPLQNLHPLLRVVHKLAAAAPPLAGLRSRIALLHPSLALAATAASVTALRTRWGVAYSSDQLLPFSSTTVVALANLHPAWWAPHIASAIGSSAHLC